MKATITWIVLANAGEARVLVNRGVGQGLDTLEDPVWTAAPASEFADRAGRLSGRGPEGITVADQSDTRSQADAAFAQRVAGDLDRARAGGKFDRLIVVAAPHFLGHLRHAYSVPLTKALHGEIDKDFTSAPRKDLERRLADLIAL